LALDDSPTLAPLRSLSKLVFLAFQESFVPRVSSFHLFAVVFLTHSLLGHACAQQDFKENLLPAAHLNPGKASLKICLRLEDESPFLGSATVVAIPEHGNDVDGTPNESGDEALFSGLGSGTYRVEAKAPGFVTAQLETRIESGNGQRTLFVVMKPKPIANASLPVPAAETGHETDSGGPTWIPDGIDEAVPAVDPNVACPVSEILRSAEKKASSLVSNLEKFTATERVEHYVVDAAGQRRPPEVREFNYVVEIAKNPDNTFYVNEYRNGSADRAQFPAHIATEGLPALALVFHPALIQTFKFDCEGMGQRQGRPAWQLHFIQRTDQPNRIRSYYTGRSIYHIPLKGRVWVDASSYQVLRLESELVEPVKQLRLTNERTSIEYAPVQFHGQKQQMWLPHIADLYVEKEGRRYYRRHIFRDFKIFNVDTAQNIQGPKESYSFTNTSDNDVAGVFTVTPSKVDKMGPVSITVRVPAHSSTIKLVGTGKDVNLPPESVEAAIFVHNGQPDSVKVDCNLVKESVLDLVPQTPLPSTP
jgi:hypothetical protein